VPRDKLRRRGEIGVVRRRDEDVVRADRPRFGQVVRPAEVVHDFGLPEPQVESSQIRGEVVLVDRFGNLVSNIDRRMFDQFRHEGVVRIAVDGQSVDRLVATYAEAPAGSVCALFGSSEHLELAVSGGSAADLLHLGRGAAVRIDRG